MKKIALYILPICLSVFSSCTTFLDEIPTDRLVLQNFYATPKDAQAAVDAIYGKLSGLYIAPRYNKVIDFPTDDMKTGIGAPNVNAQDLEFLRINSENLFVKDVWEYLYSGISCSNAAIEGIPDVEMGETLKNRMIGEAKFLRAFYYFILVRMFGDVPCITKLESLKDAMIPRTPKEQVYQQIIEDLSFAETSLPMPQDYSSKDIGRATKGAAKILLGKVYLTMGDFTKAKDKLAEVVENENSYGYGLHTNFADNWNTDTEAGIEAVFYVEFKKTPYPYNARMIENGPKYSIPGGNIGFNCNEANIPTVELYHQFNENDTRRNVSIRFDFLNPKTGKVLTSSIPLFGKYWKEGITVGTDCDINLHIIRYADAILMYAEALNETDNSPEALTQLNRIRTRAFGNESQNFTPMSKDDFRNAVIQERRLEFVNEDNRWYDLVRTGTFVQRIKDHSAYESGVAESNKIDIAENIKDTHVLFPIPQREIDLNPALTQNPGY